MSGIQPSRKRKAVFQTKNKSVRISSLIFFSSVRKIFERCGVAEDSIPIHSLDQFLEFRRVHPSSVEAPDEPAHARPSDVIQWNVVLLEPLEHADVRQS